MALLDVVPGGEAPLLVGARNGVDAELGRDRRVVVQGLGQIVDRPPDEHPEGTRIVALRAADDPVGPLRGSTDAATQRRIESPLLGHAPQVVGGRVPVRMRLEARIVGRVQVDHPEDVLAPAGSPRGGHQALDVEHVGVEQQVHQGLEIVGVGAADVRGDEHARPLAGERPAHGRRGRRRHQQEEGRNGEEEKGHGRLPATRGSDRRCGPRRTADPDVVGLRTRGATRTGAGARSSSTPARWSARSPMR